MADLKARLVGVELYFENLGAAKTFYAEVLGLPVQEYDPKTREWRTIPQPTRQWCSSRSRTCGKRWNASAPLT
jgi:predicted enzyme related to lactoylglutathione lyase